ncbi:hypothetical protein EVG20_g1243 [Dentipellis fragilis]|uniref:DUF3074 domain-containing protein n=1 Tax=Dentipellis fragilis TaxID=205917 RepID=A0A4Y9ZB12_9AGAM|nr:hypothetical protein EVG20_g1243 [Dentipellis fragilis]
MATDFQLTIKKDLKPSAIPSEDVILSKARELMNSSETWKKGKSYHKDLVHTFHRPKGPEDGAAWHCRVSQHTAKDATFDEFWNMLGKNHSENEIKYIKEVKKATLLKEISPSQSIWSMYYEFAPPVSPRFFTVLQIAHLDEASPKTGIFVSIPVDVSEDPEMAKQEFHHATRGRYCSVERIKELGHGKVEWRMATSSTPGGHIPTFLVESTMASTISASGLRRTLLNWLVERPQELDFGYSREPARDFVAHLDHSQHTRRRTNDYKCPDRGWYCCLGAH